MTFQFADIVINTQRYEMRRGGELITVEPLVFNLITHMVSHPQQLIDHDELIEAVWCGRCVSDSTISSAIKNARKALGDDGHQQRYIKTVYGRGFRFIITPECMPEESGEDTIDFTHQGVEGVAGAVVETLDNRQSRPAVADSPSLLILPCRHTRSDSQLDDYVAGLVADIETILTRIPLLKIKSYSGSGVADENTPSPIQLSHDYSAHYLLDGSSQVINDCFRLNIRLTDITTGNRLWGELFEVKLDERGFPVKQLTIPVVTKLEPQLIKAMLDSSITERWESSAQSLCMQATGILAIKGWHKDTVEEAIVLLRKSIALDPKLPLAAAGLAGVLSSGYYFGLLANSDDVKEEAYSLAERALLLDSMDSTVLAFVGCVFTDLGYISRAKSILQHAVKISSVNGVVWGALGRIFLIENKDAKAVKYLRKSIQISSQDSRLALWGALLAFALLRRGDEKGALKQAQSACELDDIAYYPRVVLAIIFLARRCLEDAKKAMIEAYRIKPDLSLSQIERLAGVKYGSTLLELID